MQGISYSKGEVIVFNTNPPCIRDKTGNGAEIIAALASRYRDIVAMASPPGLVASIAAETVVTLWR